MHDVTVVRFYLSSINQLLIIQENPPLKSTPKVLPPIYFICVFNVDKDKPIEDQLKVIKEDVLYTLNEMYQVLQVVKQFNQRLFGIEAQLKAVKEGLKEAKKDTVAKA